MRCPSPIRQPFCCARLRNSSLKYCLSSAYNPFCLFFGIHDWLSKSPNTPQARAMCQWALILASRAYFTGWPVFLLPLKSEWFQPRDQRSCDRFLHPIRPLNDRLAQRRSVGNGHDAVGYDRLLNRVELDHRKADCREHQLSALKSHRPEG